MQSSVVHTLVTKHENGKAREQPDLLAVEEPLEIRLGFGSVAAREQQSISVTMRTPGHDFELVAGFLFTEGIIKTFNDVETIHYCNSTGIQEKENVVRVELKPDVAFDIQKLQRNFYTTSSCGVCGKSSIESLQVTCTRVLDGFKVSAEIINGLPDRLREHQAVFDYTGGLHAVSLFDCTGEILFVREDVGRHNAFDKVVGASLTKQLTPLSHHVALVSGRASFELVQKAIVSGIPMLCAVGAPSSLAVDLAREFGITLIGFVRDQRFNIYCNPERIEG
jgi:FdhD protein